MIVYPICCTVNKNRINDINITITYTKMLIKNEIVRSLRKLSMYLTAFACHSYLCKLHNIIVSVVTDHKTIALKFLKHNFNIKLSSTKLTNTDARMNATLNFIKSSLTETTKSNVSKSGVQPVCCKLILGPLCALQIG